MFKLNNSNNNTIINYNVMDLNRQLPIEQKINQVAYIQL